jgi:hypothetical protein
VEMFDRLASSLPNTSSHRSSRQTSLTKRRRRHRASLLPAADSLQDTQRRNLSTEYGTDVIRANRSAHYRLAPGWDG